MSGENDAAAILLGVPAMHVLFVHQNFPAQFGHVARRLVREQGWQCTVVSRNPAGGSDGVV